MTLHYVVIKKYCVIKSIIFGNEKDNYLKRFLYIADKDALICLLIYEDQLAQ